MLCLTLWIAPGAVVAAPEAGQDHRAWQHGVNLTRVGERLLLVWASAGNPPRPTLGGDWPHDIYYAWLDVRRLQGAIATTGNRELAAPVPRVLVALPEAQEPPSVAINSRGTLLLTSEDGHGGINQHAGLWDRDLRVLRKYPFTIRRGGHSGHAAAMGERFLVAYAEGWVQGGGWRGLGTGESVYARSVGADGSLGREVKLTPEGIDTPRDGWPLVAGSARNWLVVWQRYPELTLQGALVDAAGVVQRRIRIMDGLPLRYAYDVQYSSHLGAYVVAGASGEGGFVSLIGLDGEILNTRRGLPPMVSESRIVLGRRGDEVIGVYPVSPSGVAVVRLATGAIELQTTLRHPYRWDYPGTAGAFVAPGRVLFATLSTTGLRLIPVDIPR